LKEEPITTCIELQNCIYHQLIKDCLTNFTCDHEYLKDILKSTHIKIVKKDEEEEGARSGIVSLLCAIKAVSKCCLRVFNTCIYYFCIDAGNSEALHMNNQCMFLTCDTYSFHSICMS